MSRRASLPGASELFRRTGGPAGDHSPQDGDRTHPGEGSATSGASVGESAGEPSLRRAPRRELDRRADNGQVGAERADSGQVGAERADSAEGAAGADATGFSRTGSGSGAEEPGGRGSRVGVATARKGTGRQKHDAKITVYVSADELLAMEHTRLALRGSHGLAVDRGRIVREAVAVLLADFEDHGADSVLVRRLRDDEAGSGISGESGGEEAAD